MAFDGPILVVGATGKQGGAVAAALLTAGASVRALVRDPGSSRAQQLSRLGVNVVPGDLDDQASIRAAAAGARAVFSVQIPDLTDLMGDSELRHGRNLVEASRAAGVEQIVHSSVAGSGSIQLSELDETRWGRYVGHYWRSKIGVEAFVREAGVARWTILRPGPFMENLVRPSYYFADLTSDRLLIAIDPDALVGFVAVQDIGAAAAAAFAEPTRFHQVELDLVGDVLTYRTVAGILSKALGETIAPPGGPAQARTQGLMPEMADAQEFAQQRRRLVDPATVRALGIRTTSFQEWVDTTFTEAPVGVARQGV